MPHMSPMVWKTVFFFFSLLFLSLSFSWEYFYPSVNQ